jgi:phosphatidylglycerophosphate synthase
MSPLEEKIYYPLANLRTVVFRPASKLFTRLGISADMISHTGVLFMVIFVLVLPRHPVAAFWLLFARMMADIMDGPLARYQNTDSERGKFVDVLMDNLAFALFIFGTVRAGLLGGVSGSVYLFVAELVVVLRIIRYNFKYKSEWYFCARAGSLPYNCMYASYLLFAVYAFGGSNYLNGSAQIFSIILALRALTDYWSIQRTVKKQPLHKNT